MSPTEEQFAYTLKLRRVNMLKEYVKVLDNMGDQIGSRNAELANKAYKLSKELAVYAIEEKKAAELPDDGLDT
jgi:hypothetical protein